MYIDQGYERCIFRETIFTVVFTENIFSIMQIVIKFHTRITNSRLMLSLSFSLFANDIGFSSIYSCESSEAMYEIQKKVLRSNRADNKISVIPKHSSDIKITKDIPKR